MKMTKEEKEAKKKKIVKGMPYTEDQLREMHFTSLSILLGALGINPFKLEDKSINGKIQAILENQ